MPRIRKKTSNRLSISDRSKIQRSARDGRKKKAKAAKKNPQWKSKHKKDPGIPNDFPYKEQILAEVAEQRRLAAEEKQKRKEEKRLSRQQTKQGDAEDPPDKTKNLEEPQKLKNLDVGGEAIASLSAKLINPKLTTSVKKPVEPTSNEEEEPPILLNHDLPTLGAVLETSDVLLEVLDARDPLPFRSTYLEKIMEGKKVLLVLNKIDTCPREALSAWLSFLRREHPTYLFRSATAFLPAALESTASVQGKAKAKSSFPKDDALGAEAILTQLSAWAQEKQVKDGSPLNVAVVGLTNAGKSAFLNSLLHRAPLPIYSLSTSSKGPTTTVLPQEVTLEVVGKPIRFVDTPGLTWSPDATETETHSLQGLRACDILLRNKGRIDRLKDSSPAVEHIVSRTSAEDLMLMYNLPAFTKGDRTAFLAGVARSNHLVKKRGELDLAGASKIVLRDWNTGKFSRYTMPPIVRENGQYNTLLLSEADEKVLSQALTRKEIRRGGGLVKLSTLEMERREVALLQPWREGENDNDDIPDGRLDIEGEENDGDNEGDSGSEEDEETNQDEDEESQEEGDEESQAEDDEEDEGNETRLNLPTKRKRAVSFASPQPAKKVAFVSQKRNKSSPPAKRPQGNPETKSILKKTTSLSNAKPPKPHRQKEHNNVSGRVANTSKHSKKNKAGATDPNAYDFSNFF